MNDLDTFKKTWSKFADQRQWISTASSTADAIEMVATKLTPEKHKHHRIGMLTYPDWCASLGPKSPKRSPKISCFPWRDAPQQPRVPAQAQDKVMRPRDHHVRLQGLDQIAIATALSFKVRQICTWDNPEILNFPEVPYKKWIKMVIFQLSTQRTPKKNIVNTWFARINSLPTR